MSPSDLSPQNSLDDSSNDESVLRRWGRRAVTAVLVVFGLVFIVVVLAAVQNQAQDPLRPLTTATLDANSMAVLTGNRAPSRAERSRENDQQRAFAYAIAIDQLRTILDTTTHPAVQLSRPSVEALFTVPGWLYFGMAVPPDIGREYFTSGLQFRISNVGDLKEGEDLIVWFTDRYVFLENQKTGSRKVLRGTMIPEDVAKRIEPYLMTELEHRIQTTENDRPSDIERALLFNGRLSIAHPVSWRRVEEKEGIISLLAPSTGRDPVRENCQLKMLSDVSALSRVSGSDTEKLSRLMKSVVGKTPAYDGFTPQQTESVTIDGIEGTRVEGTTTLKQTDFGASGTAAHLRMQILIQFNDAFMATCIGGLTDVSEDTADQQFDQILGSMWVAD